LKTIRDILSDLFFWHDGFEQDYVPIISFRNSLKRIWGLCEVDASLSKADPEGYVVLA